jgi:hypothetical protein
VTSKYSMHPFYTIGHSTRSITEFVDLLGSVEVTLVVSGPSHGLEPTRNITVTVCRMRWDISKLGMNTSPRLVASWRNAERLTQRQCILAEQELS